MKKATNKIVVILGPTSSGKSEAAIRIARKFNGEIISADSRQIYRGMDIGTGKISGRIIRSSKPIVYSVEGINHYLISTTGPKTEYNVSKFKKDANYVINYLHRNNKLPIICGGTGFWIKAVVDDVDFPEVKPDKKLRDRLEKKSAEKLFEMLQKLDPQRANNIDPKNKIRLIRAIEICKELGKVPIPQIRKNKKYEFLQIGIDIPKEKLQENIKKRLKKRFAQGMIKEVESLKKSGLSWKKIQSFGLGYFWIPLYLQKKLSKEELFEKVYQAEKDYAKRQMTWFKKDQRIVWLPVCQRGRKNYEAIKKKVAEFLS
jgi:tRNA dimethylallyltransferase